MQKNTKVALGVLAVVLVVVLSVLSTNSKLFKGKFSSMVSTVTEAQCRQLAEWARQGVLTQNAGATVYQDVQQCEADFPYVWAESLATQQICTQISQWARSGILSNNWSFYGVSAYVPAACQRLYPNLSYTLEYDVCKKIRTWELQGVLTQNITAGIYTWSTYDQCRGTYPQLWPPPPPPPPPPPLTEYQCEVISDAYRNGAAWAQNHPLLLVCKRLYPNAYARSGINVTTCRQLATWYRQGVLTQNSTYSHSYSNACAAVWPLVWNPPANAPSYGTCKKFAIWSNQGVLSQNINTQFNGDWSTFITCSGVYPELGLQ